MPDSALLIVKVGETYPSIAERLGDYEDWVSAPLGLPADRVRVVDPRSGALLPDPETLAGAVVTGSSALITDRADWSVRTGAWMAHAVRAQIPLLGICYGHQLLAEATGGRAGFNPRGREIGTIELRLTSAGPADPLLGALPERGLQHATHRQSVLDLPPGATLLAENARDPHQAFRLGPRAWGVQFHPEFPAEVIGAYLRMRRPALEAEGLDVDALVEAVRETPDGRTLLRRFGELVATVRW